MKLNVTINLEASSQEELKQLSSCFNLLSTVSGEQVEDMTEPLEEAGKIVNSLQQEELSELLTEAKMELQKERERYLEQIAELEYANEYQEEDRKKQEDIITKLQAENNSLKSENSYLKNDHSTLKNNSDELQAKYEELDLKYQQELQKSLSIQLKNQELSQCISQLNANYQDEILQKNSEIEQLKSGAKNHVRFKGINNTLERNDKGCYIGVILDQYVVFELDNTYKPQSCAEADKYITPFCKVTAVQSAVTSTSVKGFGILAGDRITILSKPEVSYNRPNN